MISAQQMKAKMPEGWDIASLCEVVDINPESRDPTQNPIEKFSYIDIDAVENGSGKIGIVKVLSGKDAPSRARRVVRTDDVIMSEVRPYLKAFALVPKKLNNQICSTGFAVLRSKGTVDPKYLLNTLFLNEVIDQCNRMMVGAQYPALNDSQVKKIQIQIPPLPEQRHIASILTTVDDAIQRSQQAAAETERLKAGVMHELMTKGIGHTEFREDPIFGRVPKEWAVKKLGEISDIVSGGTPSRTEKKFWNGNIPWIKTGEINYNIINSTEEKITQAGLENSAARIIPKGTLLMALYGQGVTRGRVAITGIEATINQACAAIMFKENVYMKFIFYFLSGQYESMRSLSGGSNQNNLNIPLIKSVPLSIPPLAEQQQIATILSTIDRKLTLQRQRTVHYERLKQGLMNELLTGKRRVMVT
ncbi:MAG: restriction endonuclease subunit S [Methanoregula sp.]